jgi:hypothetical protein
MEKKTRFRRLRASAALAATVLMIGLGGLASPAANAADSPIGSSIDVSVACNNDGTVNSAVITASLVIPYDADPISVGVFRNDQQLPSTTQTIPATQDSYSSGTLNATIGDVFELWVQDPQNVQNTYVVPKDICPTPTPEPTPVPTPEPTTPAPSPTPTPTPTLEPTPEPTVPPTPTPTPTVPTPTPTPEPTPTAPPVTPTPTPTTSPTVPPTEPPDVKPMLDSATFGSACIDGKPGAQGAIYVNVPKGSDPVKVMVKDEGTGKLLFEEVTVKDGQAIVKGQLPVGDYDLNIFLNGTKAGSGLVTVKACEDTSTPTPAPTNPPVEPTPTPTPGTPEPTPQPTVPPVTPTPTDPTPSPTITPTSPTPSPAPVPVPTNPTPPSPSKPPVKAAPPVQPPTTTNVPPLASTGDTVITEASGANTASAATATDQLQQGGLLALFGCVLAVVAFNLRRLNKSASNDGA